MQLVLFLLMCTLLQQGSSMIGSNKCSSEMDSWSEPPRRMGAEARWAIVALTRKLGTLGRRNKLIADAIRPHVANRDITVIIFSEMQFDVKYVKEWEGTFSGLAKVKAIDTSADGFTDANGKKRYGYKYMCKFFMLDMYKYLDNYDYYWRVDSDDFLTDLRYDIFGWVERNDVHYGWAARKIEGHGATRRTLPQWSAQYVAKCKIWPSALMDQPLKQCFNFYNNFHIGKVSFFKRPDVQHFLQAVNASGFVDAHRWGDSTIQAYAVRLFMDTKHIRMLPNLIFIHKSHGNKKISTYNKGAISELPQSLPYWVDPSWKGKDWI
jgi:hypothetical protein